MAAYVSQHSSISIALSLSRIPASVSLKGLRMLQYFFEVIQNYSERCTSRMWFRSNKSNAVQASLVLARWHLAQ